MFFKKTRVQDKWVLPKYCYRKRNFHQRTWNTMSDQRHVHFHLAKLCNHYNNSGQKAHFIARHSCLGTISRRLLTSKILPLLQKQNRFSTFSFQAEPAFEDKLLWCAVKIEVDSSKSARFILLFFKLMTPSHMGLIPRKQEVIYHYWLIYFAEKWVSI